MKKTCAQESSLRCLHKFIIMSLPIHQLLMIACLDHLSMVNNIDYIRVSDCRQAMSNGDRCTTLLRFIQSLLYNLHERTGVDH